MKDINVIGIDLAKDVFQVHAEEANGTKLFNRQMKRKEFKKWMTNLPACLVGMEACGSSHYWGREFLKRGHEVKLINPRKVKAFVDRNKNDEKDAEAICDATRSKKVMGIAVKSESQQVMTSIHRSRSLVVRRHTQVSNHLRSQLAEYGFVAKRSYAALIERVKEVLSQEMESREQAFIFVVSDLYEELKSLKKRLLEYDKQLSQMVKGSKAAKKLMEMPGVGEITATAIAAKVEDFSVFKRGRDFASWLGLTPKEYSSAGKQRLGGISKQGDRYIRTLLIHGARSVIRATICQGRDDTSYHRWIHCLVERRGKNKAVVALANKHARMIWAMMRHDRLVDLNYADQWWKAA